MRNTGLDEAHAGIKIARRNVNNLRYTDDTTLMPLPTTQKMTLHMDIIRWSISKSD